MALLFVVRITHTCCVCSLSTDALDWSAARGHDEVVQFLLAHRKEGCTEKALDWSSHGGHSSINSSLTEKARLRVRTPHYSVVDKLHHFFYVPVIAGFWSSFASLSPPLKLYTVY